MSPLHTPLHHASVFRRKAACSSFTYAQHPPFFVTRFFPYSDTNTIMPNPYCFIRPLLFRMDAEKAHELMLNRLARSAGTPLAALYRQPRVQDAITLAGLTLPNRVGLAAGLDKNARAIDGLGEMGFGFIEVGTVTPLAQAGNPRPRIFRLPEHHAIINRMGFNNDGLDAFVRNVQLSRYRQSGGILGLNIGKNAQTPIEDAASDYLKCLDGVYPHADYVTVNISSPNTKNLRSLQSDSALDRLLEQIMQRREQLTQQHQVQRPIFLKIAPDLDEAQIHSIAGTLRRHGMDGVIASNTTVARDAVAGHRHANEAGGLSGTPVFAQSNAVIRQLRAALGAEYPIIGVGGITTAAEAVAKIQAGADAVQLYTGLIYKGSALVSQAAQALRQHGSTTPPATA